MSISKNTTDLGCRTQSNQAGTKVEVRSLVTFAAIDGGKDRGVKGLGKNV